jgi:hypothetical protein
MKKAWKFLDEGLKSNYDDSQWVIGEWRTVPPPTGECVGLNASLYIQDALGYVKGTILAEIEYGGVVIKGDDKITCGKMRVLRAWNWTKECSVEMAIFAAESVIAIYESRYPNDNRPRNAINAAKNWLANPAVAAARDAAVAAARDAAVAAARDAAVAAAWAVGASAAAWAASAASAARAGAEAMAAAWAAEAADSAARAADSTTEGRKQIIHDWIVSKLMEA